MHRRWRAMSDPADLFAVNNDHDGIADVPPGVSTLFEKLALSVIARGFRRYSADAILHRVRWHHHVEIGDRDFKCNDHWTAPLARWFLRRHPEHSGFFETRVRKSLEVGT